MAEAFPRHNSGTTLNEELESYGLCSDKWLQILRDKFEITSLKALEYLSGDDIKAIIEHAKQTWEKRALEDCISSLRANKDGNKKTTNEDRANEDGNQKTTRDIIQKVSGGAALCGVDLASKFGADSYVNTQVIECPNDIEFLTPSMGTETKTVIHENRMQQDNFKANIERFGIYLSADLSTGDQALLPVDNEKKDVEDSDTSQCIRYASKSRCYTVATKAFVFDKRKMKLSPSALQSLKELEKNMSSTKLVDIKRDFDSFFKTYGSHVNTSKIHLGGIYMEDATCETRTGMSWDMADKLMNEKLEENSVVPTTKKASTHHTDDKKKKDLPNSKNTKSIVDHKVSTLGGPTGMHDYRSWQDELVKDKTLWVIIDRGKHIESAFTGIWEILENHAEDFTCHKGMAILMEYIWHKTNKNEKFQVEDKRSVKVYEDQLMELLSVSSLDKSWKMFFQIDEDDPAVPLEEIAERLHLCEDIFGYTKRLDKAMKIFNQVANQSGTLGDASITIQKLLNQQFTKIDEKELELERTSRVRNIYGNLWICQGEKVIVNAAGFDFLDQWKDVYLKVETNQDEETPIKDINDVAELEDYHVAVGTKDGLFIFTCQGKCVEKLMEGGNHICLEFSKGKLYTFTKLKGTIKIFIYQRRKGGVWHPETCIGLVDGKEDACGQCEEFYFPSICLLGDEIFINCYQGNFVFSQGSYSKVKHPKFSKTFCNHRVCYYDETAILFTDTTTSRGLVQVYIPPKTIHKSIQIGRQVIVLNGVMCGSFFYCVAKDDQKYWLQRYATAKGDTGSCTIQ